MSSDFDFIGYTQRDPCQPMSKEQQGKEKEHWNKSKYYHND